jgi:superfamily II DNA or RNA helicase
MLQEQMASSINLPHSVNRYNEGAKICIFTMQTLVKIMRFIPLPNVLYIDEAHFGGKTLDDIALFYKSHNVYSIFLSATPETAEGRGFIHWTDTLIQGKSIRWLIDNKILSDYRIYAPNNAMNSATIYGDIVNEWQTHASGLITLGFCVDRNHARETVAVVNRAGLRSAYIDGTMAKSEQCKWINALADKEIDILFSVALVTTGFDLEQYVKRKVTIEAMVDLAKCNSLPLQLQKWGRALRYKAQPAIILDMVGNTHTHGVPCSDREWTLEGKAERERREANKNNGNAYICHGCGTIYNMSRKVCPSCKTEQTTETKTIKVLKGELTEIDKSHHKKDFARLAWLHGAEKAGLIKLLEKTTPEKAAISAMLRQTKGKYDVKILEHKKKLINEIMNGGKIC